ncbi:MAG: GDP-mannose 4,6-dehydratase, partial [Hyphomicrobiales bacterium]|nr:GDP-mannose 4,6-dehydratase [Hyphomicrobiales bacterium]
MATLGISRRILLTGAGGFVGAWVLRRLESGQTPDLEIFAGAHGNAVRSRGANAVRLEITDRSQVDEVVRSVMPSAVIHLAAVSAVREANEAPRRAWQVNLDGTMNLAESLLTHVPQARFLFASTSEVYGGTAHRRGGSLDETAPLDPLNAYAASKAAADLMVGQMARDGLNAIRVRPFNHTGPGQTERFVIPAFAAQIARIEAGAQEPVMRVGNLDGRRDFLDVRDVADAYLKLALSPLNVQPGLVLNLASGTGRRIGDVLDELISLSRVKIRVETDPSRLRTNETPFAAPDTTRIRNILAWKPQISWSQTLADMLDSWRAQ